MEQAILLIKQFLEHTTLHKTLKSMNEELQEKNPARVSIKDIITFNGELNSYPGQSAKSCPTEAKGQGRTSEGEVQRQARHEKGERPEQVSEPRR